MYVCISYINKSQFVSGFIYFWILSPLYSRVFHASMVGIYVKNCMLAKWHITVSGHGYQFDDIAQTPNNSSVSFSPHFYFSFFGEIFLSIERYERWTTGCRLKGEWFNNISLHTDGKSKKKMKKERKRTTQLHIFHTDTNKWNDWINKVGIVSGFVCIEFVCICVRACNAVANAMLWSLWANEKLCVFFFIFISTSAPPAEWYQHSKCAHLSLLVFIMYKILFL